MRQSKLLIIALTLALLVTMVAGCKGPPLAEFASSVTSGQAPLSVTFSNTSQNAEEFRWDFGDGATTTTTTIEEPAVHEYTKAGTHTVTLTAIQKGEPQLSSTASLTITVSPDALDRVTLAPIHLAAGETEQLEAIATDQYGNPVSGVDVAWTVTDEDAGSVTRTGLLTAGEVAGTYDEAIEIEVTQGEQVRTAMASVTVTPGSLEQVVIGPNSTEIGIEMTQQFVAVGADQFGNRISGLSFNWSVENGGGTIDVSGLFTAGDTPGTYNQTVKAEATQGSITQSGTANVTVEPDRIVFMSDREDDRFDIYVMEMDGSNQEQLTTSGVEVGYYSCSPDGRRLTYGTEGDIIAINDDGTWLTVFLSGRKGYEPAWSPDGTKIAFQSWEHEPSEIYVMDVDGGNLTRLTDNSAYDDYPIWSPDGTKIAFVSDRDGNREIYVMNANGTNQRRLTNHNAADIFPVWSPDGTEILFQSGRVGGGRWGIYIMDTEGTNVRPLQATSSYSSNCPFWSPDGTKIVFHSFRDADEAEIYIMDRDGNNVTRLTTNSANAYLPRGVPRKRGIEVTEASVIIPNTSTTKAMTTHEVTELARRAVVRIETDLGSGSGFIIDSSGLILTNNHVISDAEEITVHLEDGASYTGTVEARDLVRDLALVKINATGLPYLEMGDLSEMSLGQQVIVLGYPLDAETITVTSGLVSAIDFDSGRNITWVQTDSAVNPGNSGGPMLDLRGRVIGVVTRKKVWTFVEGGLAPVDGIGFAISANTVNTYFPQLEAKK